MKRWLFFLSSSIAFLMMTFAGTALASYGETSIHILYNNNSDLEEVTGHIQCGKPKILHAPLLEEGPALGAIEGFTAKRVPEAKSTSQSVQYLASKVPLCPKKTWDGHYMKSVLVSADKEYTLEMSDKNYTMRAGKPVYCNVNVSKPVANFPSQGTCRIGN